MSHSKFSPFSCRHTNFNFLPLHFAFGKTAIEANVIEAQIPLELLQLLGLFRRGLVHLGSHIAVDICQALVAPLFEMVPGPFVVALMDFGQDSVGSKLKIRLGIGFRRRASLRAKFQVLWG